MCTKFNLIAKLTILIPVKKHHYIYNILRLTAIQPEPTPV